MCPGDAAHRRTNGADLDVDVDGHARDGERLPGVAALGEAKDNHDSVRRTSPIREWTARMWRRELHGVAEETRKRLKNPVVVEQQLRHVWIELTSSDGDGG